MRAFEAVAHGRDILRRHPAFDQVGRRIAAEQPVEDPVGLLIADPEIPFVGLSLHEVCRGRLVDDRRGNAEVARERPNLRLEEIADRVERR